jgi:hypothetical protein
MDKYVVQLMRENGNVWSFLCFASSDVDALIKCVRHIKGLRKYGWFRRNYRFTKLEGVQRYTQRGCGY